MKNKFKIIITCSILILFIILSIIGFLSNKTRNIFYNSFKLIGSESITVDYGKKYVDTGTTAYINGINYKNKVTIKNNININKTGTYKVIYTLKYKSYEKTLVRNVSVVDKELPIIKLNCDNEIYLNVNDIYTNCGYSVIDNYDTNLNNKVIITTNVNTNKTADYVTNYKVTDSSGNTVEKNVIVHVVDDIFKHTYVNVSITEQKLWYYQYNKVVLETPITSGKYNSTKTGTFYVNKKVRNTYLIGKDYRSFVQYWIAYDGHSYGLHDASWRKVFGTNDYYKIGSHGCINMPTTAIAKLYPMIEIGTPVYIYK